MSDSRVKITAAALSLLLLAGCAAASSGESAELISAEDVVSTVSYKTLEAALGSVTRTSTSEASIDYETVVQVTCAGFAGAKFADWQVNKGDEVKAGDVLAVFERPYEQSELDSLRADLEIARLKYEEGLATRQAAVDTAQSALDSSYSESREIALRKAAQTLDRYVSQQEASLDVLAAKVSDFETKIKTTELLAPIDGIVDDTSYQVASAEITDSTKLCSIYDPDSFYLKVNMEKANAFRHNSQVLIKVVKNENTYTGRVVSTPDVFGNTTGTVVIRPAEGVTLDDLGGGRRTITVTATLVELTDVLVIPSNAIQQEEADRYVNILEDGVIKKRYVLVGNSSVDEESMTKMTHIVDGLSVGDVVVIR